MMRNLLLNISYCGTNYHGYQVQANAVTIAEKMQNAIRQVVGERLPIIGCSRTDAKVHANSYFLTVKTTCNIPCENFVRAVNCHLPYDIAVHGCVEVPIDFHPRYETTGKEYLYKIWNHPIKHPFLADRATHYPYPLDLERMQKHATAFVGTHDFAAFCAAGGKEMDTTRTIHRISMTRQGSLVELRIAGDGFLYNMVRIMVGTLLDLEQGQCTLPITDIIAAKDRRLAGRTARPEGLYLNRVFYGGTGIETLNTQSETEIS